MGDKVCVSTETPEESVKSPVLTSIERQQQHSPAADVTTKADHCPTVKLYSPEIGPEDPNSSIDNMSSPTSLSSSPTSIPSSVSSLTSTGLSTGSSTPGSVPSAGSTPVNNGLAEEPAPAATSSGVNRSVYSPSQPPACSVSKEDSPEMPTASPNAGVAVVEGSSLATVTPTPDADAKPSSPQPPTHLDASGALASEILTHNSDNVAPLSASPIKFGDPQQHHHSSQSNSPTAPTTESDALSHTPTDETALPQTPYNPHTPITPEQQSSSGSESRHNYDLFSPMKGEKNEMDKYLLLPNTQSKFSSSPKESEKCASPSSVGDKNQSTSDHGSKSPSPQCISEGYDSVNDNFNESTGFDKWQQPHGNNYTGNAGPNTNLMSPNANRTPSSQSGLIEPYPLGFRENYVCGVGDNSGGNFYNREGYPNPTPPYPTPPYPTPPYGTMTTVGSSYTSVNNLYSNACSGYSGAASYPTPSTPSSGYTNPNTPSSSYPNPTTPSSSYGNPTTPNSAYHNPTTPNSAYPNPSTPTSSFSNTSIVSTAVATTVGNSAPTNSTTLSLSPTTTSSSFAQKPSSASQNYGNPATPGNNYGNPTTPGSSYANPSTPGSVYPNPTTPGNAYPNPTTPASNYANPNTPNSSYANPTTPGCSYPNPTTPGSVYVNPSTPGSTYPNPSTPGYGNPATPGSTFQNPNTRNTPNTTYGSSSTTSCFPSQTTAGSNFTHSPASSNPVTSSNSDTSTVLTGSANVPSSVVNNSDAAPTNYNNLPSAQCSKYNNYADDNYGLSACQNRSMGSSTTNNSPYMDCPDGSNSKSYDLPHKASFSSIESNFHQNEKFLGVDKFMNEISQQYSLSQEKFNQRSGNQALEALTNMTNSHHGLDMPNLMPSFISNNLSPNMPSSMIPNMANSMGLNMPMGMPSNLGSGGVPPNIGMGMANAMGDSFLQSERLMNSNTSHMMSGILNSLPNHLNSMKNSNYDLSHYMNPSIIDNMPPHMQNINSDMFSEVAQSVGSNMSSNYEPWMPSLSNSDSRMKSNSSNMGQQSSSGYQGNQNNYCGFSSNMGYDLSGVGSQHHLKDNSMSNTASESIPSMSCNDKTAINKYGAAGMSSSSVLANKQIKTEVSEPATASGPSDIIYNNVTPDTYYNQPYAHLPEGTSINVEHRRPECPCILCYHHCNNVAKHGAGNVRNHVSCVGRGRAGWFTKPSKYRLSMKVTPGPTLQQSSASNSSHASIAESISSTISSVISSARAHAAASSDVKKEVPEFQDISQPLSSASLEGAASSSLPGYGTSDSKHISSSSSNQHLSHSANEISSAKGINQSVSDNSYAQNSLSYNSYINSHSAPKSELDDTRQTNIRTDNNSSSMRKLEDIREKHFSPEYNARHSNIDRLIDKIKEKANLQNSSHVPTSSSAASILNPITSLEASIAQQSSSSNDVSNNPGTSNATSTSSVCNDTSVTTNSSVTNVGDTLVSAMDTKPLVSSSSTGCDTSVGEDSKGGDGGAAAAGSSTSTQVIANTETKDVKIKEEKADQLYSFNESSPESPVSSPIRHKSKKRKKADALPMYKSEIFSDPQSNGIKLKLKLTKPLASLPKSPSYSYAAYSHTQQQGVPGAPGYPYPPPSPAGANPRSTYPTNALCSSASALSSFQHSSVASPLSSSASHLGNKKRGKATNRKKRKAADGAEAATPPKKRRKRKKNDALSSDSCDLSGDHTKTSNTEVLVGPPSRFGIDFPHVPLLKIFQYVMAGENCVPALIRLSRVCWLWYKMSKHPSLWHTADLSIPRIRLHYCNERLLMNLLQTKFPKVEHLNLTGWSDAVTSGVLQTIGNLCRRLKSLNLTGCNKLHADNVATMLSNCDKLERLDLTNIMGCHKPTPRGAVGQQTLVDLFQRHSERLTHISLAHNTISGLSTILSSLSTLCSSLEVLDLSRVETVGRDMLLINLERLQQGCTKLRVLRLSLTKAKFNAATMGEQAASPGFPELEHLYLANDDRNHVGVNDQELERILKNSTKLTLLDVRGCLGVSDGSLVRIRPWNIEHLYLSGGSSIKRYSDRLELVIRKWAASLQELDLAWTGDEEVVDAALMAVAEEATKLRVLNLCGSSCTVKSVRKVLQNCVDLGQINLSSCRALPRGIKRLYQNDEMITLRRQVKEEEEREKANE